MSEACNDNIYAPNLRLFTYHLKSIHLTNYESLELSPQTILDYYRHLFKKYKFLDENSKPIEINFRDNLAELENIGLPNYDLLQPKNIGKRGIQRINPDILDEGAIYPQLLNDTYSLHLLLYRRQGEGQDGIPFSELAKFKPPDDFLTGTYSTHENQNLILELQLAFWETTIFLSGFYPKKDDDPDKMKTVADDLLQKLLGISLEDAPPFYQCGNFLDGYLYEYGSPYYRHRSGHIIILLIFNNDTTKYLKAIQWNLPELFLYLHKNKYNFIDSQKEYKEGKKDLHAIEEIIKNFPQNIADQNPPDLSSEELQALKKEIKNLLDLSLKYTQRLRSLDTFQNTIRINTENYLNLLDRFEQSTGQDFSLWRNNADRDFKRFDRQISADLIYLQQGGRLLDTAINTIRGLVDIDQAERDRHLEHQIQSFGSAIAVGAIVASTSTLIFQEWTFPWQEHHGDRLHPFIIAVLASLISAGLVWAIFQRKTWCRAVKWIGRIVGGRSGHKNP